MAPRQLTALLAMPPALRPLVLAAAASPTRTFSAGRRLGARGLKGPLTVAAFRAPRLPTRPWAAVPVDRILESPTDPDGSLVGALEHLFTRQPATFYHGTSNFYDLKKNTQVPEICILGRSNAGKSTFVNALANRRGSTLARVSAKAGHTKAMNIYGFGPPPSLGALLAVDPAAKKTEDMPKHCLYVVDMPGYGHKSLREWGRHIELYLQKRAAARGAVLLIDAEVGPKPNDFQALDMLCEHGVKTTIVLTKADKARHEDVLRDTCQRVLLYIRELADRHPANSHWAWEPEFFVTAVGATKKETGLFSVDVARLAVARLAGMIKEKERAEEPDETPSGSGNIVSFDQLEARYAPAAARPPPTSSHSHDTPPPPAPADDSANWTPLERAARAQYQAQTTSPPTRPPTSSTPPPQPTAPRPRPTRPRPRQQRRAFHTQPDRRHKGKPTGNLQPRDWIDFEARAESDFARKGGRPHQRQGDLEIESEERLERDVPLKIARPDHRELTKVLKDFIENLRKELPPAPQPRLSPDTVLGQPVPEAERRAERKRLDELRRRQEAIFEPLRKSLARYGGGGGGSGGEPFPPPPGAQTLKPLNQYRTGEIFDPLHKPRWWPPDVYAARMEARSAERRRHVSIAEHRLAKEAAADERRRLRAELEEADRLALEGSPQSGGRRRRKPRRLSGDDDDAVLGDDRESRWADGGEEDELDEDEDDEEDAENAEDAAASLRTFHRTLKGKKAAEAKKKVTDAQKRVEEGLTFRNQKARRLARRRLAEAQLSGRSRDGDDDDEPEDAFEAQFKDRR